MSVTMRSLISTVAVLCVALGSVAFAQDPAQKIAGVRFNVLMSVVAIVCGLGYLLLWGRRPVAEAEPVPGSPGGTR